MASGSEEGEGEHVGGVADESEQRANAPTFDAKNCILANWLREQLYARTGHGKLVDGDFEPVCTERVDVLGCY